jgi:hypothetical protein
MLSNIKLNTLNIVFLTVSLFLALRLNGWIYQSVKSSLQQGKEIIQMITIAMRAFLVLSMLFASAGGTVALAAQSLPDSPLYGAKLAVEEIAMKMENGPEAQAERCLLQVQERVREIIRLAEKGQEPGDAVQLQLQQHLRQAMQLAAQLGEGEMLGLLTKIQSMTQTQAQLLRQAQACQSGPAAASCAQALQAMARVQAQVQAAMQDPEAFCARVRAGQLDDLAERGCQAGEGCIPVGSANRYGPSPEQPGPGEPRGNPECPNADCIPAGEAYQYRYGQNCDGTEWVDDCDPVGAANRYGAEQEQPVSGGPGPGQPGGNPDCTAGDCEPVGEQHQYGPQPEKPGPGQPSGNPDCPNCIPEGEKNQHGGPASQPGSGDAGGKP